RAAVSSFGISGTNAHVILEQPPGSEEEPAEPPQPGVTTWLLSARTEAALADQARRLLAIAPEAGIGASLATARSHLEHRAGVAGAGSDELRAGLGALAGGQAAPNVTRGNVTGSGKVAFLFTGQGSQRLGMGRDLYDAYPVFADALDEVLEY